MYCYILNWCLLFEIGWISYGVIYLLHFQIYSDTYDECSELCFCADSLVLTCHALCVPIAPCRTALAFYSHASPAYQAFRGRCLCYSGKFICMRPPPGEYVLPGKCINSLNTHKSHNLSGYQASTSHTDHDPFSFILKYFFFHSGGIFLLLGYSSMDEELLRAYTNLGIQDTIRAFQQYIYNHIDNQVCHEK